MKSVIIVFFVLFNCSSSFSQNLTFKEILELRNQNYSFAKKELKAKNWGLGHEHFSEEMNFGDLQFLYDNNNVDKQARSSLTFFHSSNDLSKNRIQFVVLNEKSYNDYLRQLKSLDFKFIESKNDVNQTVEVYKNSKSVVKVIVMPVENYFGRQQTFYTFYITDIAFQPTK